MDFFKFVDDRGKEKYLNLRYVASVVVQPNGSLEVMMVGMGEYGFAVHHIPKGEASERMLLRFTNEKVVVEPDAEEKKGRGRHTKVSKEGDVTVEI